MSPATASVVGPGNLPHAWREAAANLRRFGAEPQARTLETCADELVQALTAMRDDCLGLRRAAAESGYSVEHLGRLVRDGTIPNAGRPSKPLIRRGDLPIKPGVVQGVRDAKKPEPGYSSDGLFRDIINSKNGGR